MAQSCIDEIRRSGTYVGCERRMKKSTIILLALAAACLAGIKSGLISVPRQHAPQSQQVVEQTLANAIAHQSSGTQVHGSGLVTRVLSDDNDGSRHQRFIVRLATGQTLLIAHNIDLAPRVAPLTLGDRIEFNGEYEWNPRGGVIHWTHHDPSGRHRAGWIKRNGQTYK
jgi:hypothetical protein